jgi:hypothetical protein
MLGSVDAVACSASALDAFGTGPSNSKAIDLDNNNDNKNDSSYEDDALECNDNDNNNNKELKEAITLLEDIDMLLTCLFCSVVCTNKDYGLDQMMQLPDLFANALAIFMAVKLQVLFFFSMCSLVCACPLKRTHPFVTGACNGT